MGQVSYFRDWHLETFQKAETSPVFSPRSNLDSVRFPDLISPMFISMKHQGLAEGLCLKPRTPHEVESNRKRVKTNGLNVSPFPVALSPIIMEVGKLLYWKVTTIVEGPILHFHLHGKKGISFGSPVVSFWKRPWADRHKWSDKGCL